MEFVNSPLRRRRHQKMLILFQFQTGYCATGELIVKLIDLNIAKYISKHEKTKDQNRNS